RCRLLRSSPILPCRRKRSSRTWKRGNMPEASNALLTPNGCSKANGLSWTIRRDGPRFVAAHTEMQTAQKALDILYARWAELEDKAGDVVAFSQSLTAHRSRRLSM